MKIIRLIGSSMYSNFMRADDLSNPFLVVLFRHRLGTDNAADAAACDD